MPLNSTCLNGVFPILLDGRKDPEPKKRLDLTPAQVLVSGFAVVILLGALLLTMPFAAADGQRVRFLDAVFTATSATCVTGLVVFDTGTKFTHFGQIVILALIQVGGLGFMTFSTLLAFIIRRKIGLRSRALMQEAFNFSSSSGVVRLAIHVLAFTAIFEFGGAILLTGRFARVMPFGQAVYYGIFHAISAFCNAGFDLMGRIFGPYSSLVPFNNDWGVLLTIGGLIVVGGIGFPVLADIFNYARSRGARKLSLHAKVVLAATGVLLAGGTLILLLLEWGNPGTLGAMPFGQKLLNALFASITPRTAGYNSINTGAMVQASLFLTVILMFIGASPCSTGGGVKTSTVSVVLAAVLSIVKGKQDTELYKRRLPTDALLRAGAVLSLALSLVLLVTGILSVSEKAPFLNILFEAMSGFGTVGLTTGITPSLTDLGRVLIILLMFAGRLGPLTLAVAIGQRSNPASVHYPEERVMIG